MSHIRFGRSGQAYVIEKDGRVVAHTNPELVLRYITLGDRPRIPIDPRQPGSCVAGYLCQRRGHRRGGRAWSIEGIDWVVLTELPVSEAFASTRTALVALAGGLLVMGLALGLLLSRAVDREILEPLDNLRRGSEQIGAGNLNHRIELARHDEIGQVWAAFNQMVERLVERDTLLALAEELVTEVNDRTRARRTCAG